MSSLRSSYRMPKAFKPATLDSACVDMDTLEDNTQQLWHFTFPAEFNVAAFSELELHLPATASTSGIAQQVASFDLDGVSYRLIEGAPAETEEVVNLFPSPTAPGELVTGKPFKRCFRICRDITFPAPAKPIPVNPLGRAPRQIDARKNCYPIGFISEKLPAELARGDRQGRILRSTSDRPQSPRLLKNHGYDRKEWKKSAASAKASSADAEAEEKRRKKEKKEAKKRAAESSAAVVEPPLKKLKPSDDANKSSKKEKKLEK